MIESLKIQLKELRLELSREHFLTSELEKELEAEQQRASNLQHELNLQKFCTLEVNASRLHESHADSCKKSEPLQPEPKKEMETIFELQRAKRVDERRFVELNSQLQLINRHLVEERTKVSNLECLRAEDHRRIRSKSQSPV